MLLRHKLSLFVIISGLLTATLTYGVSIWVLDDFLTKSDSAQNKALIRVIKQDVEVFDRLLLLVEKKWEDELEKNLTKLALELSQLSTPPSKLSEDTLRTLASKYKLSDLHLINKDMLVFASTFADEVGLDMGSYSSDYVANLSGIFNNDQFFTHRVSLSTVNGSLKKYAYYSQKGSDIIVNGDIDLKERLLLEENNEIADYLFGDYVDKLVHKYESIKSIDLFILSPVDQWSLFNPGNRLEETIARKLYDGEYKQTLGKNIHIEHVNLQSYRQVGLKAFLQVEFDNALLIATKSNLRVFFLISACIIVIISFAIVHFLTRKLILDRFSHLLIQIKEKQSDEDDAIEISGSDELSELGNEINKLMSRIHLEKNTNKWLTGISHIDSLTGVGNRRWLDHKIDTEWRLAKEMQADLSVLMIDIDNFKQYNDQYGHLKGDECLQLVAEALSKVVEAHDGYLARFGGEEFVCILPKTKIEKATRVAAQIQSRIAELSIPHMDSKAAEFVSLSIGCVSANGSSEYDSNELLQRADSLLYKAKRDGKNRIMKDELR